MQKSDFVMETKTLSGSDVSNYTPIFVLPCFSKLLEILQFVGQIIKSFENNEDTLGVFTDLPKAFHCRPLHPSQKIATIWCSGQKSGRQFIQISKNKNEFRVGQLWLNFRTIPISFIFERL